MALHSCSALGTLFSSHLITREKNDTIQANIHCIYKSLLLLVSRDREEGRVSQLVAWHWETLQEEQGLYCLFPVLPSPTSGLQLSICLGEEGTALPPISTAPVGLVTQQGNSPFMQQQNQTALCLLMRDQQGSREPVITR